MGIWENFWVQTLMTAVIGPFVLFTIITIFAKGRHYLKSYDDTRAKTAVLNVCLFFLNAVIYGTLFTGVAKGADVILSQHIWQVPETAWGDVPIWVSAPLALIALDFINYWNHRVLHSRPVWPVHAVHHSDQHMTWTTSYRVHVLEGFLMAMGVVFLAGWLNFPVEALTVAGAVHGLHNKYVHCQLGWTHGPLRGWIISPNFHRWHHAEDPMAYNKNFGDLFVVWDRMFKTYYDPGPCDCDIGLEDGPHTLGEIMIYPFRAWAGHAVTFARKHVLRLPTKPLPIKPFPTDGA